MTPGQERPLLLLNASARGASRWLCERNRIGHSFGHAPGEGWIQPDDLRELTALPSRLVVFGGDGTLHRVVGHLCSRGAGRVPPTEIAIVPSGTGNNFARSIGIPLDGEEALQLSRSGRSTRRLDLFELEIDDGTVPAQCLQSAALGFPAAVGTTYDRLRRSGWRWALPRGPAAYRALARCRLARRLLCGWSGDRFGLRVTAPTDAESSSTRHDAVAIFLCNDGTLGGGFTPCPTARPDDGLADLLVIPPVMRREIVPLFTALARGRQIPAPIDFHRIQTGEDLTLESTCPVPLLVDGEPFGPIRRIRIAVRPSAWTCVVP